MVITQASVECAQRGLALGVRLCSDLCVVGPWRDNVPGYSASFPPPCPLPGDPTPHTLPACMPLPGLPAPGVPQAVGWQPPRGTRGCPGAGAGARYQGVSAGCQHHTPSARARSRVQPPSNSQVAGGGSFTSSCPEEGLDGGCDCGGQGAGMGPHCLTHVKKP